MIFIDEIIENYFVTKIYSKIKLLYTYVKNI